MFTLTHMRLVFSALACSVAVGCATIGEPERPQQPPQLTAKTPTEQIVHAAGRFGDVTLKRAQELLESTQQWDRARGIIARRLMAGDTESATEAIHLMHLYQGSGRPVTAELFLHMVDSDDALYRQLAWQAAAALPAPEVARAIDAELTRAVLEDDEDRVLERWMAEAVRANEIDAAYSLVRRGLMLKGHEEFAEAMIVLRPRQAAQDFLDFLALTPVEELRQLTQKSLNVYTVTIALRHMRAEQPPANHPRFPTLFLYATSRNLPLAEAAQVVLEGYLPAERHSLAFTLAQMPAWVQIAYIQNVSRKLTPASSLFLTALRETTAHPDVMDEIRTARR